MKFNVPSRRIALNDIKIFSNILKVKGFLKL